METFEAMITFDLMQMPLKHLTFVCFLIDRRVPSEVYIQVYRVHKNNIYPVKCIRESYISS